MWILGEDRIRAKLKFLRKDKISFDGIGNVCNTKFCFL